METQIALRYVVILASLIVFSYQVHTALTQVLSGDTVDSTEYIPISKLDPPPIITFCPRQTIINNLIMNEQKYKEWGQTLDKLGYYNEFDILTGMVEEMFYWKLSHYKIVVLH